LTKVESGDMDPGVPGPSTPVTECSGELIPVSDESRSFAEDIAAGASSSHPDTTGLKGALKLKLAIKLHESCTLDVEFL